MRLSAVEQEKSKYKIIAVDDEMGIIDSLKVYLREYSITGVTNPQEAIERVKNEHFDLMLLDYIMTPFHGDHVVEEIQQRPIHITTYRSQRFSSTIRNNKKARHSRLLWKKW